MTKTVLITGGAARIGAHLSKGLAADDWTVIIHYFRSKQKANDLASEIESLGGKALTIQANLSVPQECDSLIERASSKSGQAITALINNASTFQDDRAETFTRAAYDYHMEANLRAPILLSQHFAAQAPSGSNIINIIDQRVLKPNPQFFSYSLSKAGLHWATTTMAQALAPNIRVNAIGPGPVLQNTGQSELEFAEEASQTLLGRGSPPESLLQAVSYLLSATSVTGQFLAVDSGQHLRWETPDIKLDKGQ
ncbi:NAD(P)-dependent dehydrogenase (short-subunit alcohol dehydrogenase family) [Litorimonas taeanensis]|uniref:NAD(P)-dependent dehydrogenase (Short-subunit alcohol dehydrogenase family) n=1 Tax=Litorimonas taeanensis TaxID=568099 RepID=A0A420WJZ2_9PROT|nr:SDR family oxidoreductase [Litorimonas taeanensis]RKQ71246.1 NAD(P)-dependent dehydrogenase (short-subunit alcohol dehydrogenase family) [Litorimonas taeanensis]